MTTLFDASWTEILRWVRGTPLEVVMIVAGSVLLARLVTWVSDRVTNRIDAASTGSDALVRSEAAKHRHSVTQVLRWVAIVLIYTIAFFVVMDRIGIPVTGLVAPATVLGVGLGFGAQRVVQDLLAGFFIITERQYGFGDVVAITATGVATEATGTVEDVTLRITRLRSSNGEVITVPNGQIVKVVNLSRDWARAVVDVPVQSTTDVNRVNEILHQVGTEAFADPHLKPLLLDEPSVMGVESLGLEQVNLRMVARTLPGKQFEVGRDLRARVVAGFRAAGLIVDSSLSASDDDPPSDDSTTVLPAARSGRRPRTAPRPEVAPPADHDPMTKPIMAVRPTGSTTEGSSSTRTGGTA